ncbi:MAG: sterol desaturase family protein [Thermoanaerobaculia bacterium]
MMLLLLIGIAAGLFVIEKLWPAMELPKVDNWWARVALVNLIQLGIVVVAGVTWDRWLAGASLFSLRELPAVAQGLIAYFLSTFIYYWWHRLRHESDWFWRVCHQLHHSPRRIEVLTSFYKHPVEITLNSILSAAIVYPLLGCSIEAGAVYTVLTALAEYFYHWNISTPRLLGYVIQRPEAHRVHHQYQHHTQNFADLPVWDIVFGTYNNPRRYEKTCGFDDWREDRFEDMLVFRDVHADGAVERPSLQFLPTCIGCRKRWACAATREEPASGD